MLARIGWRTLFNVRLSKLCHMRRSIHSTECCIPEDEEPICESLSDGNADCTDPPDPPVFGRPKRLEEPGAVRLGFIPEEWFQMFYDKTGVTGPYVFGIGLFNFLASKEIYVMEHEFYNGISMAIMAVIAVKKLGPSLAKWADKEIEKIEKDFKQATIDEIKDLENDIKREKLEQWHAEGAVVLVDAKRDNIGRQIEAEFRKSLYDVYKDVVQKLDYQVECYYLEQRIHKRHMVQWVAKHVIESLPPMQKEDENKAKKDMSAMALQMR